MATNEITLEEIKTKWLKNYDEKEKEKADYLEKYEIAKERINQAIAAADRAYKNADMKGYYKAQEDKRFNEDAAQMYYDKVQEIEREPYITKKEFRELFKEVEGYFNGVVDQDRESLANVAMEMVRIKERESAALIAADEFIKFAQVELLKSPERLMNESGMVETMGIKHLSNYDALSFVRFVCNHAFISKIIEAKQKECSK